MILQMIVGIGIMVRIYRGQPSWTWKITSFRCCNHVELIDLVKWVDTTKATSASTGTSPPIFPLGQTRFAVYMGSQRIQPPDFYY